MVMYLLDNFPITNNNMSTALKFAVFYKNVNMIKKILSSKVGISKVDDYSNFVEEELMDYLSEKNKNQDEKMWVNYWQNV